MNNLLHLKGTFIQADRQGTVGAPLLPSGQCVSVIHLRKLQQDLKNLRNFWEKEKLFSGALIDVFYRKVAAKTNRIKKILSVKDGEINNTVVGARFTDSVSPKHIITHYISLDSIDESIDNLQKCIEVIEKKLDGVDIDRSLTEELSKSKNPFGQKLSKTPFLQTIVDANYVEKFAIPENNIDIKNEAIVTIYKTDLSTIELMDKLGINIQSNRLMEDTTILLQPNELSLLKQKAPYLISMAVSDLSLIDSTDFGFPKYRKASIPSPNNEPTIGVIDTLFDETVYFSEWVNFKNMLSKDIPISQEDYQHGTAVSSLIVDGPAFNPELDDGCGRFRVRHFGVSAGQRFSSFSILKNIEQIVSSNKDIKVWNLSLGSIKEINKNFISPEAAILDKIQYENDVVFVIAGTNKGSDIEDKFIGAPADSINSLVVNSVKTDKTPASYSRHGPVLSFFTKPDICYYGGDDNKCIRVCTPTGEAFVKGTSFAAPWIARKMSYLIDVLGFNRETAKALIINSATDWNKQGEKSHLMGFGVVPIRIEDIVRTPDDEIQFILTGVSEKYDTFNFNIPVPVNKNKHPYIAKATLCYFPKCSRNQGIDYTNTELDISFGRLQRKSNSKVGIKAINNNYQSDDDVHVCWEEDARKQFRKWDNVKHIREVSNERGKPKDVYGEGLWGISLKTKERLEEKFGKNIKFSVIVTLKEINGVNRINEFIQSCLFRGWLVQKIDIENRLDIYEKAEENIILE